MWLLHIFSSFIFLTGIVLSIPLAFDVGGQTCGLAYSLSLAIFHFFFSLLKLATPERSRFRRALVALIRASQWLVVPTLLIWSLNRFSVDAESGGSAPKDQDQSSFSAWFFGRGGLLETLTIGNWDKLLRWSTPVFQLVEGFCSLLVIQAAGQITRWLVNRSDHGDTWMVSRGCQVVLDVLLTVSQISLLVLSASVISSSVYFLWRVLQFPEISNVDAALIGVAITCAVILSAWGIGSGRGNAVESSLLFAYIVLCIYQIFTDYVPSQPAEQVPPPSQAAEFPPLPPIIMASYTTLMHVLSLLPSIIHAAFNVITAALSAVAPSVLISLAYRLFVFYASTRIIPAVRESGARALSQEASLDDDDGAGQLIGLLSWFSPSILVAIYTSLLMQHFASTSQPGTRTQWWLTQGDLGSNFWRWVNIACTMALYAIELYLGKHDDIDGGLTGHWKTD